MEKTTEELIKEFLDNGGKIEKLPPVEVDDKQVISSISPSKVPELMTLAEGEQMFGKKQKRKKKKKEPDYSGIDMSLIPEHLHEFIKNKPATDKQDDANKGGTKNETD